MDCNRCGKCCIRTSMQLSSQDIRRLEKLGYKSRNFTTARGRFRTLKNVDGVCYFYDIDSGTCEVYAHRPEGCRYYPIIYCIDEGKPIIDEEVCDRAYTITKEELEKTTPRLTRLIRRILEDSQAETTKEGKNRYRNRRN